MIMIYLLVNCRFSRPSSKFYETFYLFFVKFFIFYKGILNLIKRYKTNLKAKHEDYDKVCNLQYLGTFKMF
jgi:hypothetical protein